MNHIQLRAIFSTFWQKRGHKEVPPISLVPENDPTTLFTGSGMQQLIPYFMGEPHPLGTRLYNVQRSFRSQDIEEVGDNRHDTFFEMMGNWSLGDYFKNEQLPWFFELLTKELGLEKNKLYVSVFKGDNKIPKDEESANIWKKLGIAEKKIVYYGADKNWWSRSGTPDQMPEGEIGGPDSEVFYDLGTPHNMKFGKVCHPNCDCGRFLEIGNSVFIQYEKVNSELVELPKKNVDFGGGLERLLVPLQEKTSIFQTDIFTTIIYIIVVLSGKRYGVNERDDHAIRIIADHLKAATFLIADGVTPSNNEQGYVLRRLIRRSVRFGRQLGLTDNFCGRVVPAIVKTYRQPYPHLTTKQHLIETTLNGEEKKFGNTIERGMKEFEKMAATKMLTAKDVFFLYESYGFPIEVTEELAEEKGIKIDFKGLAKEKLRHKQASQKGMDKKFKGGLADHAEQTIKYHTATHLLHQALRTVLGNHVQQKGSNITVERLRFDFSHAQKLRNDELVKSEEMINEKIRENLPVTFEVVSYNNAIKQGALAFFGQRYPKQVKVYSIANPSIDSGQAFSKEVCAGPHVERTGILGKFTIIKEESVSAGIRRIYAVLK